MFVGVIYLSHVFFSQYRSTRNEMALDLFLMGLSAMIVISTILYRRFIDIFQLSNLDVFWRDPFLLTKLMHVGIWFVGLFLLRSHKRLLESSFTAQWTLFQGIMVFIAGWYVGISSSVQLVWMGLAVALAVLFLESFNAVIITKQVEAVWNLYPPRIGTKDVYRILRDYRWANYFLVVVTLVLLILQEMETFFSIPSEISQFFTSIGFWIILFLSMALYYFGLMLMLKNDIRVDHLQLAALFSRLEVNPIHLVNRLPPEFLASIDLSKDELLQSKSVLEFKQRLYEKLTQQRQASLAQVIEYMKRVTSEDNG